MSDNITDIQTNDERAEGLKAWGWVSYLLHLIVAVGAVMPSAQPGVVLLIIALARPQVDKGLSEREALGRQNTALMAVFERAGFDHIAPDIIQPRDFEHDVHTAAGLRHRPSRRHRAWPAIRRGRPASR